MRDGHVLTTEMTYDLLVAVLEIVAAAAPYPLLAQILRPTHPGAAAGRELAVPASSGNGVRHSS